MIAQTKTVLSSKVDGIRNVTTYIDPIPNNSPTIGDIQIDITQPFYTFTASVITDQVTDLDNNSVITVQIQSIPLIGVLTYQGVRVSPGKEIPINNINQLVWYNSYKIYGERITTFTLAVKDGGIPPNLWSNPSVVSFNITNINTAPTVDNSTIQIKYATSTVIQTSDLLNNYFDAEGNIVQYIVIQTIPPINYGRLLFNNQQVTQDQLPLRIFASDVSQQKLIYQDTGELTNEKRIFIEYTVEDNSI